MRVRVLLFFAGFVQVLMRVSVTTVLVIMIVLDVLVIVGLVRVRMGVVVVLVLVLMGRFVRVFGHHISLMVGQRMHGRLFGQGRGV